MIIALSTVVSRTTDTGKEVPAPPARDARPEASVAGPRESDIAAPNLRERQDRHHGGAHDGQLTAVRLGPKPDMIGPMVSVELERVEALELLGMTLAPSQRR
jgi:hypothetical protein